MNPLKHFLDSFWTYREEVFYFISGVMLGVTMIYIAIKFLCDIVEFELNKFLKWYMNKRK
jgi:hypothetical protein